MYLSSKSSLFFFQRFFNNEYNLNFKKTNGWTRTSFKLKENKIYEFTCFKSVEEGEIEVILMSKSKNKLYVFSDECDNFEIVNDGKNKYYFLVNFKKASGSIKITIK